MRHARFLERAGKREEAAAIWQALVARHARTQQVLSAAGDFFERTGADERAEAAYRAAARFRECPPQVRLRLGQFSLDHGDRQQAMEDLEALLAQTRPEIDQYRDCIPLPERLLSLPSAPATWRSAAGSLEDSFGNRQRGLQAARDSRNGATPRSQSEKTNLVRGILRTDREALGEIPFRRPRRVLWRNGTPGVD